MFNYMKYQYLDLNGGLQVQVNNNHRWKVLLIKKNKGKNQPIRTKNIGKGKIRYHWKTLKKFDDSKFSKSRSCNPKNEIHKLFWIRIFRDFEGGSWLGKAKNNQNAVLDASISAQITHHRRKNFYSNYFYFSEYISGFLVIGNSMVGVLKYS